jgi:D-alanine-D-alanine ligase
MTSLATKFGKVGVLYGGISSERDISLMTGAAVHQALCACGIDAIAIDVQQDLIQTLSQSKLDLVFVALHGPGGEDGTIQGALEYLAIPYTGSGVMASALAMDKLRCKQLWKGIGLPTADFASLNENSDWDAIINQLGGSVVVKPACEGSSMGMSLVETPQQLRKAWQLASEFDAQVIAESQLQGEEYTLTVLGDHTLPSIRIQSQSAFYDYEAKYISNKTQYFCPSGLSEQREAELRQLSLNAFESIGCSGWGRVDLMTDTNGNFHLLEVNTVPGMTSHSLVPMAAKAAGMEFEELVCRILQEAL